jgi:hypothetical protein
MSFLIQKGVLIIVEINPKYTFKKKQRYEFWENI